MGIKNKILLAAGYICLLVGIGFGGLIWVFGIPLDAAGEIEWS